MEGDYTKALVAVRDVLNRVLDEDTSEYTPNKEFFSVGRIYSWISRI